MITYLTICCRFFSSSQAKYLDICSQAIDESCEFSNESKKQILVQLRSKAIRRSFDSHIMDLDIIWMQGYLDKIMGYPRLSINCLSRNGKKYIFEFYTYQVNRMEIAVSPVISFREKPN